MSNETEASFLKTLKTLHLALVMGVVVITVAMTFASERKVTTAVNEEAIPFIVVAVLFAMLSPVFGTFFFNKQMDAAKTAASLSQKLDYYRSAFITRMALLEGAAILNLIITFLTGSIYTLSIAVIIAAFMLLQKPTAFRIAQQLDLFPGERDTLQDF